MCNVGVEVFEERYLEKIIEAVTEALCRYGGGRLGVRAYKLVEGSSALEGKRANHVFRVGPPRSRKKSNDEEGRITNGR